jgi:uncharacterized repeat protein (TIGR03803 family)
MSARTTETGVLSSRFRDRQGKRSYSRCEEHKPMQRQALISLFHTIVRAAVAAFLITSAGLPMPAQSSVPPTAVQAAKMPQYASRLARAGSRPAPRKIPTLARRGFQGPIIYDNGPINGRTDAWVFNSGFVVSNTFTITGGGPVAGMSFGAWLEPGDTLQSAEVSITSSEFGGTSFFDQSVNFTQSGCVTNQDGFNVCTETAIFSGPFLNAGTYWLNLNNAVTSLGAPVYWDENSGAGCQSPGCPSLASSNQVGTIPSESFSMLGECTAEDKPPTGAKIVTVPPSPTLPYRVIYNFTGAADGGFPATGLVIDPAGNLYGTTGFGGSSGSGTTFKLSPSASGWRFTRLNSFSSANGFSPESTPVLDADGRLFGTAAGGGAHDFGGLFSLSPPGHILPSVFSNWMETLLYSFADGNDGAVPDGSLVLDSSGNTMERPARTGRMAAVRSMSSRTTVYRSSTLFRPSTATALLR